MSHRDFARPGTNINTVEGNKAGGRAARLTREREADQKAFEDKKAQIEADATKGLGRIDDKFDKTILNTVLSGGGLQTAAQYKAAQSQPAPAAAAPPPKKAPRAPGAGRGGAAPEEGPGPRARRPRRQAREDAADRPALVRRRVRPRPASFEGFSLRASTAHTPSTRHITHRPHRRTRRRKRRRRHGGRRR